MVLFILVKFPKQQGRSMEQGVKLGRMELDTQVAGNMVQLVVRELFIIQMATFLKDTFETTKLMEKEATHT